MPDAADSINLIIPVVDPEKKTHVGLNYALTAATIGLGVIPVIGPEVAGLSAITLAGANLAIAGLKKAPEVAKAIWPVGTDDSQVQQIAMLQGSIPAIQANATQNIGVGLALVQGYLQSDVSKFLAFVDNSGFSVQQNSLPTVFSSTAGTHPLLLAFTTFLATTALAQHQWHILQVPGQYSLLQSIAPVC